LAIASYKRVKGIGDEDNKEFKCLDVLANQFRLFDGEQQKIKCLANKIDD